MRKCKLGDLFKIKQGFAFKKIKYVANSKYAIVTLGNISESNNFKYNLADMRFYDDDFPKDVILKHGDLILPMTEQVEGLFGNSAFVPKNDKVTFVLNQRVGLVKPFLDSDKYYIHYLLALKSVRQQLEYRATGTRQRNISPDGIYDVDVKIPEPVEREKIGLFLYKLEQKINNNNFIIQTLESMAKTLYDYWFVQFDFPDVNRHPYKTSGGKMVWNEELGSEIPEGWEVKPIASLFTNERNGEWGTEKETATNKIKVTCIRGADYPAIQGLETLCAPERYISATKKDRIVKHGDLIIEISGGSPTQSTGRVNYINKQLLNRFSTPVTTSNFCKIVSIVDEKYFYYTYYTWSKLYECNAFFNFEGKTTGIKNLLFDIATKSIKVAAPPPYIANVFQKIVDTNASKIQMLAEENRKLSSLRDFLLPMLMNGQVGFK